MSALVTWLTASYVGNVTANAVYDIGLWTKEQVQRWLTQRWSDREAFEAVRRELQRAFSHAWRDVEKTYRKGGQWDRLSEDQQELIRGRSKWLDSRDRQALIFPQLADPIAYATDSKEPDIIVAERGEVNAALFEHLQDLGILEGLPRGFEPLLEKQLLNGILYHFVEDGIRRNEDLRNVLFFHQAVGLQVGQRVTHSQLDEVLSKLEQLEVWRSWQREVVQAIESLEETVRESTEQVRAELAKIQREQQPSVMSFSGLLAECQRQVAHAVRVIGQKYVPELYVERAS